MGRLYTSIEINAPPAVVRAKVASYTPAFLDFPTLATYHANGFINSIAPVNKGTPPQDLKPGDKLHCGMGHGRLQFISRVVRNDEGEFSWNANIPEWFPWIFGGTHFFRFEEIPPAAGVGAISTGADLGKPNMASGGVRTRLVHGEDFTGWLAGVYGDGWLARIVGLKEQGGQGFNEFNADLKRWVEGGKWR
ncbi:SRPBCC domain-containing protein [Aspergillus stella-maris]|uniref:SRPBCC domain-containing protein n=1 Tax=Aspergillus stella-maris TaxID=1810926 RepID=UPI003CCD12D1